MEKKRRFFQNGVLLTAVALSARAVSLFFGAFVSDAVGAEGIGLFTLIMTLYNFALTFATSGVSLTVTKLVAAALGEGEEARVRGILRAAVGYALFFSLTACGVLFFFAPPLAAVALGDVRAVRSIRLLSLSLVPAALSAVFSGYFVALRRVGKNAVTQVAAQGCRMLLTLLLMRRSAALGAEAACFALSLSSVLTDLLAFFLLLFQFLVERRGRGRGAERALSSVVSMAAPLALSAYIRSALLTLEHMLIPACLVRGGASRAEALSAYGVMHGMALPLLLLPMAPLSSFSGLLVPEFSECGARGESGRMRHIAERAFHATAVFSIGVSVLLFLFSEELGYVIYGSYDAGRYLSFLAPVVPLMYLDHVTDAVLKGIGEQVYSMWVNITDSVLSVLLVLLLLPRTGILGYGAVIILMEGYNFLLSLLRLRRRIRFSFRPLVSLLLPTASATGAALLSRALFPAFGAATGRLCLAAELAFSLCAFVAFYLLGRLLLSPFEKGRGRGLTFAEKKNIIEGN